MNVRRSWLALFLMVAIAAEAQAPATFREGVMAFEKKEWAKAEALMRQTIAGNPNETEGTVRIAGEWFETYVPHYFLARALAKQGKCAEALVAFAETERQGVTLTISDFARHVENRGGCKPVAKKKEEKKPAGEFNVPFGDVPAAPKPKTETGGAAPGPGPSKPAGSAPQNASQPATQVAPRDVESRARLSVAIAAYLRGEYELTARTLSDVRSEDRAVAAEAALFRAAARHALYRIGGEKDPGLRAQIDADLRLYRTLRPTGTPDPRIFPPSFRNAAK